MANSDLAIHTIQSTSGAALQLHVANSSQYHTALDAARLQAQKASLPFAGSIAAPDAWQLIQSDAAALIDVRTNEERVFVGYVPNSVHLPWMTGTAMNRNPRFVRELESRFKDKSAVLLFLCRSGKRSSAAAEAATKVGFSNVFNIDQGFEGDLNDAQQRGKIGGWRWHALPWIQA
jgi:rhodanese-related sulfurtransferase